MEEEKKSQVKKYYWLKLKRDFFKRHDIRIVEEMPNGKEYILFYLKLLCESVDHDGNLRFSEHIPYNEEMLAIITNTNVDIVRTAIKIFSELQMIEVLDDGTYYMSEVQKMIGTASQDDHARESTRLRVQAYRERQKQGLIEGKRYSNVTCNGEIEKEIDIEKEKDKYTAVDSVIDYLNQKAKTAYRHSETSRKHIKARLNDGFTVEDCKTVIDKKCAEWSGTEMEKYIRPETLFGSKFENYLNAPVAQKKISYSPHKTEAPDYMSLDHVLKEYVE